MRARTHIEDLEKGSRQSIIIDELPYQVNKANLLIRIGELVRDKIEVFRFTRRIRQIWHACRDRTEAAKYRKSF
jgi:DNA gyrase/topoisomerase IV subunit A